MKKIIGIIIFCACCFSGYSQDSMNKKMENKTDKMNKKMNNPNDPMNKKITNIYSQLSEYFPTIEQLPDNHFFVRL